MLHARHDLSRPSQSGPQQEVHPPSHAGEWVAGQHHSYERWASVLVQVVVEVGVEAGDEVDAWWEEGDGTDRGIAYGRRISVIHCAEMLHGPT
eukprot:SAG11_NODE_511_length_8847_cov_3.611911_9_plen_93_part_00